MPAPRLLGFLAMVAALSLLPVASSADHVYPIPDARDCAKSAAPGFGAITDPQQTDRGAGCVSDGNAANGPEWYVGGEAQTEYAYPDDPESQPGDACGAVVVGGQVLSATRPDNPSTPENEQLDWDWVHTHANGQKHHHTCN